MAIDQALTAPPTAPTRDGSQTKDQFDTAIEDRLAWDATNVTELTTWQGEANALATAMNAVAAGGAVSLQYTFSTTTTDADPGAGILRLDNATQNAATVIRADLLGSDESDYSGVLALLDDSTSALKGYITLRHLTTPTKWLVFAVTALASPSGYKNITVSIAASSAANPFANGDSILFDFTPTGDKGATGATGATGAAGIGLLITNIVSTAVAYQLTTTPTIVRMTQAVYGIIVTLPDATGITAGGMIYRIDNSAIAYSTLLENKSGTLLGFVQAGKTSDIGLVTAGSEAGVWSASNLERVGISAQLVTANFNVLQTKGPSGYGSVDMDGDIEIILGSRSSDGYLTAVAYKRSTATWGAVAVVRATAIASDNKFAGVRHSNTQLLVASALTTDLEAVIVTLNPSTLALTPETAGTGTLSANISLFPDGCGLITVPSNANDLVLTYSVDTPAAQARCISVSGTTVTIGAAVVLDGTNMPIAMATADKVIIASTTTTNLYTKPYTVTTTTLTGGTGTTTSNGTMVLNKFFALGSRWCVLYNDGGSTPKGGIVSLSGTTTTITVATLFSEGGLQDAIVVDGKVLALNSQTTNNANLLTDSAGTASAGTAITATDQNIKNIAWASGTDVAIQCGTTTYEAHMIDCSGASPVLSRTLISGYSEVEQRPFPKTDGVLSPGSDALYSSAWARVFKKDLPTVNFSAEITAAGFTTPLLMVFPGDTSTMYRGRNNLERWGLIPSVLTKIEAAP